MYPAFSDFYGKKIALLLYFLAENGETSAAIVKGTAYFQDGFLRLHRGNAVAPVPIPLRLVWRAKAVTAEFQDILGDADFVIQATLSELNLPEANLGNLLKTA